jgi:hypothetical protein
MRGPWLFAWLAAAQIRILSPESVVTKFPQGPGHIYGTTATFGTPYYGERVQGRLRYATPKTGHSHCTEQGYDIPDLPGAQGKPDVRRVVIVDRGECTFVTKVRIAQEYKGAQAVIVVDNTEMTADDIQHIIMADDGWGGGNRVRIPSIMISSAEGKVLKEAVLDGRTEVIVELAWDVPVSNVVSIDFWMSSGNREAQNFLDLFKPYVDEMKYQVQFTPHFHVFSLPKNLNNLCSDETGRFCAPIESGDHSVTGQDVLAEDLRQLCIWNVNKVPDPEPDPLRPATAATFSPKYWDYLEAFHEKCPLDGKNPDHQFGRTCSERVMEQVGISTSAVDECVRTRRDTLLQQEHDNVAWSPLALRINGWRYAGPLDSSTVLKAVCSGFVEMPKICRTEGGITVQHIRHRTGVSFFHALVVFILMILGAMVLLAVYKRFLAKSVRAALREEVMLEVRSQVQEYQALGDEGTRGSAGVK